MEKINPGKCSLFTTLVKVLDTKMNHKYIINRYTHYKVFVTVYLAICSFKQNNNRILFQDDLVLIIYDLDKTVLFAKPNVKYFQHPTTILRYRD